MPAGFQAFNDGYVLQIDGTFKNMSIRHKIYIDFGLGSSQTINFEAQTPVIVQSPDQGAWMVMSYANITPSNCMLVLQGFGGGWIYVFDSVDTTNYNFGLEVFDGAGNRVFKTSNGYMNVIGTEANIPPGSPGIAVPGGKRYGLAFSRAGYEVSSDYSDIFESYKFMVDQYGAANNAGYLTWEAHRVWETDYTYGSGSWPTELWYTSFLIVDVTRIY